MIALLLGLPTISPKALQRLLENHAAVAIDVNSAQSWRSARVPGARHFDHERDSMAELPQDGRALVFYCSNYLCRKAPLAARRAIQLGHLDVRVLAAGIKGWLAAGLPVEREVRGGSITR